MGKHRKSSLRARDESISQPNSVTGNKPRRGKEQLVLGHTDYSDNKTSSCRVGNIDVMLILGAGNSYSSEEPELTFSS